MSRGIPILGVLILQIFGQIAFGYRFACLEFQGGSCECDTDDELIDCNGRGWIKFPRLKSRLRGFSVMSLAFNDISGPLPGEADVLRQLPDLELLDLRGNSKLDCNEILTKFDRINVHSHCIEEELAKERLSPAPPISTQPPAVKPIGKSSRLSITSGPKPKVTPVTKFGRWPWTQEPFPEPEPQPTRPTYRCSSLWCRLENGVTTAYSSVYVNVHRVWVRMKNRFRQEHTSLRRRLLKFLP